MFTGLTLLSLLVALTAGSTTSRKQADSRNRQASVRGTNLNNNEPFGRDDNSKASIGAKCDDYVCGSNHNETLVRVVQ